MFKKNPNRPALNIAIKKTAQGYRVLQNETFQLFTTKKIIRSIYRPDLIQMSSQHIEGPGNSGGLASGTIIQPPSHVTIPAVSSWFNQEQIHEIERQHFPEYFREDVNNEIFSFSIKNTNLYQYYRNSMIFMWRENAKKYLSQSLCRKNLLGDVSSIMRIHAFLENWGLINFPSKQHNKGLVIKKPESLVCYVCQNVDSKIYFAAQIDEVLFEICSHCFDSNFYPQSIKKAQFRKVFSENHLNSQKQLQRQQIGRMLQIINGIPNGVPKEKDRDTWSVIQKQFPEISKEKIIKSFLKIPLTIEMNSNIFQNNEDNLSFQNPQLKKQIEEIEQPSIFEDFNNPILGSIAQMYFKISKFKNLELLDLNLLMEQQDQKNFQNQETQFRKGIEELEFYRSVLEASQKQSKVLWEDQQRKIEDLTKMLIEVVLSRIELKSLFVSEHEKLINAQQMVVNNLVKNNLAETLKLNLKLSSSFTLQNQSQNQNLLQKQISNQIPKIDQEEIWDDNDLDL